MRSIDEKMRIAEEEKLKAEEEVQKQQEKTIHLLLDLGISKAEIAMKLGLSEEEMERY